MNVFCELCESSAIQEEESDLAERKRNLKLIVISTILMILSLVSEFMFQSFFWSQALAAVVVVVSGYQVMKKGILRLLKKRVTINFLMTVATIGAFFIGHGGEGASLMLLYFIAEFLEDYAKDRSKKSITSLMKIAPNTAMVKRDDEFVEIHTHDVKIDDIIRVKHGETIPIDGVIIKGSSTINEASLTGESLPVYKNVGDEVFAGTINQDGYMEIKATKTSDQTFIAKIKTLIEGAKNRKSKTEKFIDEFAKYYTPIMILLAISVMVLPPILLGFPFESWIYRGLTLLVISCPCALALATPVSTFSALNSGSKNGILIKGGKYIEEMKKIQIVAFDKTGTLTEGSLEVKDVLSFDGALDNWFGIVCGLESMSEHPISKAIVQEAKKRNIEPLPISTFKTITGKGIIGKYDGEEFYVGNKSLFQEIGMEVLEDELNKYAKEGKTVVLFGNASKILGMITLRDKIREESKDVIKELKKRKIKTILISGDNENTVKSVQKALNIDEIYYELKPDEKQEVLQDYISRGIKVAMVGDGVNDAPSLALANVGIAMGGIGSDVSLETADIILMKDDLRNLITLFDISNKTVTITKQNIFFSISVKLLFVVLTFLGLMTLYLAVGIGDLGVTLLVILNAYRISRIRKKNGRKERK